MSKNERKKKEILFVWTVFLSLKAPSLQSVTIVSEGMSVCESRVNGSTLQRDGGGTEE